MRAYSAFSALWMCLFLLYGVLAGPITIQPPVILNASPVPVEGGKLQIYGLNLGNQSSSIAVEIYPSKADCAAASTSQSAGAKIEVTQCKNIKIQLANSIVSCSVSDVGTGKSKSIKITVDGRVNTCNSFFSREAPRIGSTSFDHTKSQLEIRGANFGFDASRVTITLNNEACSLKSVNNTVVTCTASSATVKRSTEAAGSATVSDLFVTVDGQSAAGNVTVPALTQSSVGEPEAVIAPTPDSKSMRGSAILIGIGVLCGVLSLVILVYVFVAWRGKRSREETLRGGHSSRNLSTSSNNNNNNNSVEESNQKGHNHGRFVDLHNLQQDEESEEETLANRRQKKVKTSQVTAKAVAMAALSRASSARVAIQNRIARATTAPSGFLNKNKSESNIPAAATATNSIKNNNNNNNIATPNTLSKAFSTMGDNSTEFYSIYDNDIPTFTASSSSSSVSNSPFSEGDDSPFQKSPDAKSPILGTPPRPSSVSASPAIVSPTPARSPRGGASTPGRIVVTLPPNSPSGSRFSSLSRAASPHMAATPSGVLSPPAQASPRITRRPLDDAAKAAGIQQEVQMRRHSLLRSEEIPRSPHANDAEFKHGNPLKSSYSVTSGAPHMGYYSPVLPRRARSPLPVSGIASPAANRRLRSNIKLPSALRLDEGDSE